MLVKDTLKTKNKIFTFDAESPSTGYITNGTMWPLNFDIGESTLLASMDMKTHIEELEKEWQKVTDRTQEEGFKEKLLKWIFEGLEVYYPADQGDGINIR